MADPVDISPRTFSGDTSRGTETTAHTLAALPAIIHKGFPDLRPDAELILLPADDFEALIQALAGQPYFATRGVIRFSIIPAEAPQRPRTLWQHAKAIFWGEW